MLLFVLTYAYLDLDAGSFLLKFIVMVCAHAGAYVFALNLCVGLITDHMKYSC